MVSEEILEGLSHNEKRLLIALNGKGGSASPAALIDDGSFSLEVEIMGAASWLESKGMAAIKEDSEKFIVLADQSIIASGLPERVAITKIDEAGGKLDMDELANQMSDGLDKVAVGWLKRKGLADISAEGEKKFLTLTDKGKEALGTVMPDEAFLKKLSESPVSEKDVDKNIVKDLKGGGTRG